MKLYLVAFMMYEKYEAKRKDKLSLYIIMHFKTSLRTDKTKLQYSP